jgi:acyl transferase domain-containing protein/cation diffusion facilitator CzcD-associated flavoprotein CzcO/acyl carrier protein/nucleoside-diphosphate-sugar epimerase
MLYSKDILQALRSGDISLDDAEAMFIRIKQQSSEPKKELFSSTCGLPKIAIVGMSGKYPGANNLFEYWTNLANAKNSIIEIPKDRWDYRLYFDEDKNKLGKSYSKWGGFLHGAYEFDSLFFNISPTDAEGIDPQQRLFLQEAYKAFEDAGYTRKLLNNSKCGVYLGIMSADYSKLLYRSRSEELNATGNSLAIAAARIAYYLNLKGPAISIDTACSSSLVATHFACQALMNKEINMAVAGGVTLYLTPESYTSMSRAGMLSPSGQCKAFDNEADGFVPAEGVGAIVLKRLEDAEADGDMIYGVIIGSGINQDGKTNGITAPSVNSQIELIREIYQRYNISPETIDYVETHGTGTKLGDPIELEALATVFKEKTINKNYCAIGSVKTNIGHTSGAAGVASIQKVLLSLKHKKIVPSLNYKKSNEHFDFINSPFYVNTTLKLWENEANIPRRAAISSFGFSGTNAHLVIEEHVPKVAKTESVSFDSNINNPVLIVLSAINKYQLKMYVHNLRDFLENENNISLIDMAYTLQIGREAMGYRVAFSVKNIKELKEKLIKYVHNEMNIANYLEGNIKKTKNIEEKNYEVNQWITQNELMKLAEYWVNGGEVEWHLLYVHNHPRKISLPTYPFAKDYYCAPELKNSIISFSKDLHPIPADILCYVENWVPQKALIQTTNTPIRIFYFAKPDDNDFNGLVNLLKSQHQDNDIIRIDKESQFIKYDENHFAISSEEGKDYEILFGALNSNFKNTLIIYRWGEEEGLISIKGIFDLLKLAKQNNFNVNKLLLTAKLNNSLADCYSESWIGFERSLTSCWPALQITILYRDDNVGSNEIWTELGQSHGQVKYKDGLRYILSFSEQANLPKQQQSIIKRGGVYLITGGCGGLGQIFADYLANHYQANLVLIGRHNLNEQIKQVIARLKSMGAEDVSYYSVNVADLPAMETIIKDIIDKFGHINGIIHAAGMESRKNIFEKDWNEFSENLHAKIMGTEVLDHCTANLNLDFICYFSSSSAILGDLGACDYAVGNRFQMAFAKYREALCQLGKRHGKTLAINWPFWKKGVMGSDDSERAVMYLKTSGQRYLETKEGLAIWENILNSDLPQILVLAGQKDRINGFLQRTYQKSTYAHTLNITKQLPDNPDNSLNLEQNIVNDITLKISSLMKINEELLENDILLSEYGFDSISLTRLAQLLNNYYNIEITPNIFYNSNTIKKIAEYLYNNNQQLMAAFYKKSAPSISQEEKSQNQFSTPTTSNDEQIAIIGMSGRFANADNVDELWEILSSGRCTITEVPATRWDWKKYYIAPGNINNEIIINKGAFISDIESFDPLFFEISPREAEIMDPKQRLLLEESWKTFEDAGYKIKNLAGKNCGVYVGVEDSDFRAHTHNMTGTHNGILAARISYFYDLCGPNMAINTACSSGLVALHQACQALQRGDCEIALVGGVSLGYSQDTYRILSQMNMLSTDGECYPFDKRANGLVPGEAVAAVVLKPLSVAIKDKDIIHGVISGSGVNHDGRTNGITMPNARSQSALLNQVFDRHQLNPLSIQYAIAHSVGSSLSDPFEIQAYNDSINKYTDKKQFCALSSIKPYIGHTFAASGIVSLIAMCLAIRNRLILGSKNSDQQREDISFINSPLYLNKINKQWNENYNGQPRRGIIGATGMSGTNAFAIIDEYTSTINSNSINQNNLIPRPVLIPLSAKRLSVLPEISKRLHAYLLKYPHINITDVAYTLQTSRTAMRYRILFSAENRTELLEKLLMLANGKSETPDFYKGNVKSDEIKSTSESVIKDAQQKWLIDNNLAALANLWIQGVDLDWTFLYNEYSPLRISLPSYPFVRERYPVQYSLKQNENKYTKEFTQNNSKKEICVIGAGPSGLVMAKSLLEEGHKPVIYEKQNTLGGLWILRQKKSAGAYKKTTFQTSKYTSTFSDFYVDTITNHFYSVNDVKTYLDKYAENFGLENYLHYNSEVLAVEKCGEKWKVQLNQNGESISRIFDGVAMCQGMYWKPYIPNEFKLENFKGEVIHSSQYYDNTIFKGKRVLVIGNGVSGMDIAEEAASIAHSVYWSFRSLKLILPRMVGFVPNDCLSTASLLNPENRTSQIERLKRSLPEYYENYVKSGLLPTEEDRQNHSTILINDNIVKLVAEGKVKIKGEINNFTTDSCIFSSQSEEKVDIVVFCTGYKIHEVDFLKNISLGNDFSMGIFYEQDPTLVNTASLVPIGFSGLFYYSEMIARWYAQILSGKYQLTSEELAHRVTNKYLGIMGPVSSVCFALKLGLLPDPSTSFKSFWRLLNYPAFPMINRLQGPHSFVEAEKYLSEYRKNSYIKNDEHDPSLKAIKIRLLAGLGQLTLKSLLQKSEITNEEYKLAIENMHNPITLNWDLQYIKHDKKFNSIINKEVENMPSIKLSSNNDMIITMQKDKFLNSLKRLLTEILKINEADIESDVNLSEYGFDSMTLAEFAQGITQTYPFIQLSPATFLEYTTLNSLAKFLFEKYLTNFDSINVNLNHSYHEDDIAVIGLGGRYPGSRNVIDLWRHLVQGDSLITEVPTNRWNWKEYFGNPTKESFKTDCYHGAFLDDIARFDAAHFGISPHEANLMDPQHRMLLEVAWETIENSGYSKSSLQNSRLGLFIGVEQNDYYEIIKSSVQALDGYVNTGNTHSMLVNRVSNYFGWKGPSMAVNTACSSSFTALSEAVDHLRSGKIDLALAGGVNVLLTPWHFIINRKLNMLTNQNVMKPFDKEGSGQLSGEGIGLVLLKKLSAAIKDNDHIYGVIRGISVQHGGKSMFLTAPNPQSHKEVIDNALNQAKLSAKDINYIEAQGTADPMTDKMELAIYSDFAKKSRETELFISTIKGNIGHLGAASGITALIKAIFSLSNNTITKVQNFKNLNWSSTDGEFSAKICNETQHWPEKLTSGKQEPRRIGIHNFGYGGVNGHIILEEFIRVKPPTFTNEYKQIYPTIIPLSARTEEQVNNYIRNLYEFIIKNEYEYYGLSSLDLLDMAYTLQVGREAMPYRIAFVVNDISKLLIQLHHYINQNNSAHFHKGLAKKQFIDENIIRQWIDKNDLDKLAAAWVKGIDIDWTLLYKSKVPNKIPLPTYPFLMENYWVTNNNFINKNHSKLNKLTIIEPSISEDLQDKVIQCLKEIYGTCANINPHQIDIDESLGNYGINSLVITQLSQKLSEIFGEFTTTIFFEYQTLKALSKYLVTHYPDICMQWIGMNKHSISQTTNIMVEKPISLDNTYNSRQSNFILKNSQEPIAIIGMSGRYPQARNLKEFWKNLQTGKDCVIEVPPERWSLDKFYVPDKEQAVATGMSYGKWGGFVDGFDEFDPLFFNISPKEAMNMDPQERLFIQTCWEALEDAGYTRAQLAEKYNRQVGVFVGITKTGFELYGPDLWRQGETTHPRTSFGSVANRISYLFNLQGPSMPIDTMCSSSLTAVHEACEHLLRGECELAFAGGVNLYLHPSNFIELSALQMLSVDGKCKSFDATGNGFVPGEGVGVILLKPLSRAIADGDEIHAVIKATCVNHGGKTNGYTVPNPAAQAELIRKTLNKAGVNARTVSYIEAHGTGTELGDPIEVTGLTQAFRKDTQDNEFCAIGSVKSNMGHLEAAAGIAGIAKVILQMKHKQFVPSLHIQTPNPHIHFSKTPFTVQRTLSEWKRPVLEIDGQLKEYPRIAGISSFGAGGSNAHVILEEYVPETIEHNINAIVNEPTLIVISAKDENRLREQASQLLITLKEQSFSENDLIRIAYTLQVGREAMDERLAFLVTSLKELEEKLIAFTSKEKFNEADKEIFYGRIKTNKEILSDLADDEALPTLIATWIEKKKYSKILNLWTKGLHINWELLYNDKKPRRISLPTYPFARECYWLNQVSVKETTSFVNDQSLPVAEKIQDSMSLIGEIMLVPKWGVISITKDNVYPKPNDAVLIVGPTSEHQQIIKQYYPQAKIIEISVSDTTADIALILKKFNNIDHVIWLASTIRAVKMDELTKAQKNEIMPFFKMIKTMLELGYGNKDLGWTILTFQAQPIFKNEQANVAQAGIHGLAGAMAKEYPNWKVRLIDSSADNDLSLADIFHILPDEQGNSYVYRKGEWYQQNLVQFLQPETAFSSYKSKGIYVVIGGAGGIGELWSEYMVRKYQARLVWIGRRLLESSIQNKIDRIAKLGPAPVYYSADATNLKALQQVYEKIKQQYSNINGIVHSAVGLLDQSLAAMDEEHFINALSSKVETSINLAQVFSQEPLDMILFFSSLASFTKDHGKGSYATGSIFEDIFAHQLALQLSCAVKVMNWGYWGEVGIGAAVPQAFKNRLEQSGVAAIDVTNAMKALEMLIAIPENQLAYMRTTKSLMIAGLLLDDQIKPFMEQIPFDIQEIKNYLTKPQLKEDILLDKANFTLYEIKNWLCKLLWMQLWASNLLKDDSGCLVVNKNNFKIPFFYDRWLEESLKLLADRNYLQYENNKWRILIKPPINTNEIWQEWNEQKTIWLRDPDYKAQIILIDTCLKALPDILMGKILATDVIFPDASLSLVEGIYRDNTISNYFNDAVANAVVAYVKAHAAKQITSKIRFLEIGAGTGGTSERVLAGLKPYTSRITEYCYTDISKAFLFHAENTYGINYPYLTYQLFDVSKPLSGQKIEEGSYDVIIATNVLHATRNIRQTLRNTKALLKKNGILILNEISGKSLYTHLCFGLLEGWWLHEDTNLRFTGSPGLSSEAWEHVLSSEGFEQIFFPLPEAHAAGQQIIIAMSNGIIRQPKLVIQKEIDSKSSGGIQEPLMVNINNENEAVFKERAITYIKKIVSSVLRMPAQKIDATEPLETYGIDSILVVQLTTALRKVFNNINSTLFFECQTIDALVVYLMETQREAFAKLIGFTSAQNLSGVETKNEGQVQNYAVPIRKQNNEAKLISNLEVTHEPIAIIGMSGRYPQADNLQEYWENLKKGKDCIVEIPPERWSLDNFYETDKQIALATGKSYSKWGGFLNGFAEFDPLFFNISPKEAMNINPQERLFLECAWAALEDAGYTRERIATKHNRRVGVFVGITKTGYELYGPELWQQGQQYYPHTSFGSVANRVSYLLNLKGPSIPIDTMCSSSLTAIHEACEQLLRGDCEMALAGGVNLYLHPSSYVELCALQMLSPHGQCRSFGCDADGMVPGEGVGVILLKRLSQAKKDNDHIYAVIRATGINHGGKTNGYTVPNPVLQGELIRDVLDKAKINARTVSYIEAHGTGTELGDPIEITGLTHAFMKDTNNTGFCAVGSVKSNIGHLESAAGIAGVMKIVMQLQHRQLVPSLHAENLNPNIDFSQTPFYIQQKLTPWNVSTFENAEQMSTYPRRAGLSSFGAGGANAHIILEEYIAEEVTNLSINISTPVIILLSAKTEDQLKQRTRQLLAAIYQKNYADKDLLDIAYTLQVGREAMEYRIGVVVTSINELIEKLESYLNNKLDNLYIGNIQQSNTTVKIFNRDSVLQEVIDKWLQHNEYEKLLELWVNGLSVDWEKLYEQDTIKPRCMSLPTYPFARERYWIRDVLTNTATSLPAALAKNIIPQVPKEEPYKLLTFEEVWEATPLKSEVTAVRGIVCFVSNAKDQQTISQQIKTQLPEAKIIFVSQDKTYSKITPEQYTINRNQLPDYEKLFAKLPKDFPLDSLWYLWPLEEAACKTDTHAIVYLLQALHRTHRSPRNILLAAPADHTVGQCYTASWIGFERSLGLILPTTKVACIYEEGKKATMKVWAQRLTSLCSIKDIESILYRGSEPNVLRIRQTDVVPAESLFKPGATYLITGGCGGLGLRCAEYMARTTGPIQLILSGRSSLNASQEARLEQLRTEGNKIYYLQADVSDAAQMKAGLKKAKAQLGPIQGVFHIAGIQGKESLWEKDMSVFDAVLAPKIIGTQVLDEVLAEEPLEFICYFSSAAAILGDFGSCDYAVGNRFQLAYAQYRNAQWQEGKKLGKAIVINWPLWKEGGMHMADEASTKLYLKSSGQRLLETEEGMILLNRLLSQSPTQHLVLAGQPSQLKRFLKWSAVQETIEAPEVKNNHVISTSLSQEGLLAGIPLEQKIREDLKKQISQLMHLPIEKIGNEINLADLGFDSISLSSLAYVLSNYYGLSITPSLFFVHSTVKHLVKYFISTHSETLVTFYSQNRMPEDPSASSPHPSNAAPLPIVPPQLTQQPLSAKTAERKVDSSDEPIAIIGMSGRFPQARTVKEFWQLLVEGKEAITEIPIDRFDWQTYYGDAANDGSKSNSKWMGCIPGVREFDTAFFGISPREAKQLDPRQRLLLQEGWRALEDAGYGKHLLENNRIGVYIGVEQGDYEQLGKNAATGGQSNVTANHEGILASRLSYFLNLEGPAMAINTACSSGLVAVHQACMSLRNHECDIALAGGVSLTLSPEMFVGMAQAGMLSSDGKCYAFDQRANGLVPGEAVGVVVLKRLSQAIQEGDPIDAVIQGSGINYDGKTNGITAPGGAAQTKLLQSVYDRYQIDPERIEYIVTHGTGTKLGDPVEVNALIEAYRRYTDKTRYCALTSPKSNVGHTFAASGIVGLINLVQSLREGIIPASINCEEENTYITWEGSPFYVNKTKKIWASKENNRLGAVSAFGMSGTNVHMVVESYEMPKTVLPRNPSYLLVLSAKSEASLKEKVSEMVAYLAEGRLSDEDMPSLSYTLLEGRQVMEHRCAIVVENVANAIKTWEGYLKGERLANLVTGEVKRDGEIDVEQQRIGDEKVRVSINIKTEAEGYRKLLLELAELYCKGYELKGTELYGDKKLQRIHLPTYPFVKQEYWIEQSKPINLMQQYPSTQKATTLPTLQTLRVTTSISSQTTIKPTGITLTSLPEHSPISMTQPVDNNKEKNYPSSTSFVEELRESLANILDVDTKSLDENARFVDLGLDSIIGVEWVRFINKKYALTIPATKIYDYPTIEQFAIYLEKQLKDIAQKKANIRSDVTERHSISPMAVHLPDQSREPTDDIFRDELKKSLANALDLDEKKLDVNAKFIDLGLDSIVGVEWIRHLNNQYDLKIPATKVYDYPNLNEFIIYLKKMLQNKKDNKLETKPLSSQPTELTDVLEKVYAGLIDVKDAGQLLKDLSTIQ